MKYLFGNHSHREIQRLWTTLLVWSLALAGGLCYLIGTPSTVQTAAEPFDEPKSKQGIAPITADEPVDDTWQPQSAATSRPKDIKVRQASTAKDDGPIAPLLPAAKLPNIEVPGVDGDEPKDKKKGEAIPVLPTPQSPHFDKKKLDERSLLLLATARNAVNGGKLAEAIPRFEEYLQLHPTDRETRKEYAGVLVQAEQYKLALEAYRTLMTEDPDNSAILTSVADLHLLLKEYRKAASYLTMALDKMPSNIEYAIKLVQAYTSDGDIPRAFQVFDRYLAQIKPHDPRLPKSYGAMLIDLGQLESAIPFLLALREKTPDDVEVVGSLLRAYARQGERLKAMEMVSALADSTAATLRYRLELAESLYQSTDLEMATIMFGQILKTNPDNAQANIGLARVYISEFRSKEAARILLHRLNLTVATRRTFLLAWAEYHQSVGEYTQTKQIYLSILKKDDDDGEARLALARLFALTGENEIAKAEFARLPADSSQIRQARFGIISTLIKQRHFAEALGICRNMIRDFPSDGSLPHWLRKRWRNRGHRQRPNQSVGSFCRTKCATSPVSLRCASRSVRSSSIMARQLMRRQNSSRLSASLTDGLLRDFMGWRARVRLGSKSGGQAVLEAGVRFLGELRGQLLLADQFIADRDDTAAAQFCESALRLDPTNLAAMIRLVDIRQRQSVADADITATVTLAEAILQLSPKNIRAQLALARAYSVAKKYRLSVQVYDDLITADGTYFVPKLERARVLFADNAFAAARAAYLELANLESTTIPDLVQPSRDIFGAMGPGNAPASYSGARDVLDILHGEIPTLGAPSSIEMQGLSPFQHVLVESYGRRANAKGAELEGRARDLQGWRKWASIPVYKQLVALQPDNTVGLFGLAQAHGSTMQTNQAILGYQAVLDADPVNRQASIALDRANLELQPQFLENDNYFGQRGRQNLAAIDRFRYTSGIRLPYRDEDEYVEFDFTRADYSPIGGANTEGNILTFRGQLKPVANSLLWAQVNYEAFSPGSFHDRLTFDVGNQIDPSDWVRLYYAGFLENVAESAGSLSQDIYRTGIRLGADVRPLRCWDIAANYMFADYSDHNTMNYFNVINNLLLSYAPYQLKFVSRFDYYNYANATIFDPTDPLNSNLAVHPYFAPQGFDMYENRLEWTHYLSRDSFTHANVCYYSLQYGLAWDNSFISYHRFRALINYDVRPWLSVGVDTSCTLSSVYQQFGANVFAVFRLPRYSR